MLVPRGSWFLRKTVLRLTLTRRTAGSSEERSERATGSNLVIGFSECTQGKVQVEMPALP